MRTPQQTVGSEEPNKTGSASESGKAVLIKKNSKSSRSGNLDSDTVIGADSSEYRTSSPVKDLDSRIAMRVYELYEQRGGCHGEDQADWFEAERQILSTV